MKNLFLYYVGIHVVLITLNLKQKNIPKKKLKRWLINECAREN